MQLICIKKGPAYPNCPKVSKGSRYHLTRIIEEDIFDGSNIWYVLFEMGDKYMYHSSLFAVAPEIIDEVEEEKYEDKGHIHSTHSTYE
jgi:hypothetical protein